MCQCEYTDSPVYCDECKADLNGITVGTEVLVDNKYGIPVWAVVESIDEGTGEVFCVGDDGEDFYANSVNDLERYPS